MSTPTQQVSSVDLRADLRRVADQLQTRVLSQTHYSTAGRFSFLTVCRRFGSWKAALLSLGLEPAHLMQITAGELTADLRQISRELRTNPLRFQDYIAHGKYSRKIIYRLFGSWQNAADAAGLRPMIYRPCARQELFDNLKQLWQRLGRKPRYDDVKPPLSKFGVTAYTYRYGTYRKAMAAFIASLARPGEIENPSRCSDADQSRGFLRRTPPRINQRLRFEVLRRDRFCCGRCGKSPATHLKIELDVSHIQPWDTGGETVMDNLHSLCTACAKRLHRKRL